MTNLLQNLGETNIAKLVESSISNTDAHNCLFNFLKDGLCNYNLVNSQVYLDLGGALAAFGLIFAVYQLRKPKWEIILRIRTSWQRNLFWILGGISLFLVLIRSLIIQLPIDYLNYPFNVGAFYEILAYIFFILSPLSLIYFATNTKNLFNKKNSRKFYSIMVEEISRSSDEFLNATLSVLLNNFDVICKSVREYQPNTEINQSARAILDVVLSEESVVKILTTKRLDGLLYIFSVIEKYNINQRDSNIGIPKIVQNLFYDKQSFLYKQLDRNGLALSSNIYENIFESQKLLSNFNFFSYPTIGSRNMNGGDINTEVFIKALTCAIKTYFKTGKVPPRNINDGLSYLSERFGNLCLKISNEEGRGVDTKHELENEWWEIHDIARFLSHDYVFIEYENKELNQDIITNEKTAKEADFYSNSTINEGISAALYKAFEQLSYIEKINDIWFILNDLFQGMVYEYDKKQGYREPFERRIWEQIGKNVIKRHYPAVLRIYLAYIGFSLASDENQRQGWVGEQAERMRRLLYVDLKPLLEKKTKMVNKKLMKDNLLPDCMDYKNGKFTYTMGFGDGPKKIITPPPQNSKSALEDIDLESRSLL